MRARRRGQVVSRRMAVFFLAVSLLSLACLLPPTVGSAAAADPLVAIHMSELTQALETMPAKAPTPTGTGTTGYEWWTPAWRYFVGPESLMEAFRSDGTPFVVVNDADISAGRLLKPDGSPRYPILISLASEAVADGEIAPLRNFVNAGGFLFVGSSSFTRRPDGTSRGNFALSGEMGVSMPTATLRNWEQNKVFSKVVDHRLVSHIPSGEVMWRMPLTSEEIPYGVSPNHPLSGTHYAWRVAVSSALKLANQWNALLAVKNYGKGQFIYYGAMQPLLGNGGAHSSMYAYLIFRNAVEWAFENANLPIIKVSPWRYEYDAAFTARHDFETNPGLINSIEASASLEHSVGVKGDYFFCSGTLREYLNGSPSTVSSLRRAVANHGATLGSHNGGLRNPVNGSLSPAQTDYWHWGPDEALDVSPPGYASGKAYALQSLSISFQDVEGWMAGLDNGRAGCGQSGDCPRIWVSPYYNSVREDSYDILQQLDVVALGEQKVGPFPHWTLSTQTPGKRYPNVVLPLSEWYRDYNLAQAIDLGHNSTSVKALVDFYYDLGALINLYSHTSSASGLAKEYVQYGAAKPRVWATNATGVYDWWVLRSAMSVTPSYSQSGATSIATALVSGAADPGASVEVLIPGWNGGVPYDYLVFVNGLLANPADYRITDYGVKVRTGTTAATVAVHYAPKGTLSKGPVAAADAFGATEDVTLNVAAPGVLANDTDPDTPVLTAVLASGPGHGQLTLRGDGSFTYVPAANFNGTDTFTYRASDGVLTSDPATVTIGVAAVDDPVVAADDSFAATEDVALAVPAPGVLGNDSGVDGPALTAVLVSGPAGGQLTLGANGSFTYVPAANFSGSVSFSYRAREGTQDSNTATVTIAVAAVNDTPVASADSYGATEDVTLNVPAPGLLANDSDVDGPALTAAVVSGPSHGVLTLNGNGSFSYVPQANYNGTDTFTYRASDGALASSAATVTLSVAPVSDPPVAANDAYTTAEDQALAVSAPGVLANDTDADGSTLTAILESGPAHGALTLNGNGSFLYVPEPGFNGTDGFTYRTSDGGGASAATVTITVLAVGDPPVAANDNHGATEDVALNVAAPGVLANDTDPDSPGLTATLVGSNVHGSLVLRSDGSFSYTPAPNFNGTDSFTYRASDGVSQSGVATVTITVQAVNDPPLAAANSYGATEDVVLNVAAPGVLGNDADPDGPVMIAVLVNASVHGSLVLRSDGSFSYIPAANFSGTDSFTYRAEDGAGGAGTATVTLTVAAVNDPPVAAADNYGATEDLALNVATPGVLANDADPDGPVLTAALVGTTSHGSLALASNGSFNYTPAPNFSGTDSFTYRAEDGAGGASTATVTLSVAAVNDPPVSVGDAYTVNEGQSLAVPAPGVLGNDADVDSPGLTAVLVTGPAKGTLALFGDGSLTYTPQAGFWGTDSFAYRADDGAAAGNTVQATITVKPAVEVLYADDFTRAPAPAPKPFTWTLPAGSTNYPNRGIFSITGGVLTTDTTSAGGYGYAYTNAVTVQDHSVEAEFRFPGAAYGGGIFGRLNASTGQRYSVWVFPPGSSGIPSGYGPAVIKLLKFSNWGGWSTLGPAAVSVPDPGSGWHHVKMTFEGNRLRVFYNRAAVPLIDVTDAAPLASGYAGVDLYNDGPNFNNFAITSSVGATVYSEDFGVDYSDPLLPWAGVTGTWAVTGGVLNGIGSYNYAHARVAPTPLWTDFSVEGRVQFAAGAYGGGLGGRVNPSTGARYAAWIYPDGSWGGSNTLKLLKFRSWTGWNGGSMASVSLPSVGTGWHKLRLDFIADRILVYYDDALLIDARDTGYDSLPAYLDGGLCADLYNTSGPKNPYEISVDDVRVTAIR